MDYRFEAMFSWWLIKWDWGMPMAACPCFLRACCDHGVRSCSMMPDAPVLLARHLAGAGVAHASPFFALQEHLPPEVVPQAGPVQQPLCATGLALRTILALVAGAALAAVFCVRGHWAPFIMAQEPLVAIEQEPPLSMAQEPLVSMGQDVPWQQAAFEASLALLLLAPATCATAAMARAALNVSAANMAVIRVFIMLLCWWLMG